jgi:hypothetical protein
MACRTRPPKRSRLTQRPSDGADGRAAGRAEPGERGRAGAGLLLALCARTQRHVFAFSSKTLHVLTPAAQQSPPAACLEPLPLSPVAAPPLPREAPGPAAHCNALALWTPLALPFPTGHTAPAVPPCDEMDDGAPQEPPSGLQGALMPAHMLAAWRVRLRFPYSLAAPQLACACPPSTCCCAQGG